MYRHLLLALPLLLSACLSSTDSATGGPDGYDAATDPADRLTRIAGYDVSHLGLDGPTYWGLLPQKMNKNHVLVIGVTECDTALVSRLLQDGADPNIAFDGNSAITQAMFCGEQSVWLYDNLVASGADPGIPQLTEHGGYQPLLHYAVKAANIKLVDHLIENGHDAQETDEIDGLGCRAIHSARDSAMLAYFLQRGVTLDDNCTFNRTILHNAVLDNDYTFVDYLMRNEVTNVSVRDKDGDTAYDYAVMFEDRRMMDLLEGYMFE